MSENLPTTFQPLENCLNCKHELESNANYCLNCGSKIKELRFNLKRLLAVYSESFFSLENTFTKTFIDLWIRPDSVINGFVIGLRKRYMNPVSYFAMALTISGLQVFVIKKFYPDALANMYGSEKTGFMSIAVLDYQTLLTSASIPLMAFIGWIVFKTLKKYNYAEHLILNFYAYSQYAILATLAGTFCLIIGWDYGIFAFVMIFMTIVYYTYVYKKVFGLSIKGLIFRTLFFTLMSGFIFALLSIAAALMMFLTGSLPLKA
ncbi:DUF3667 domain-containing protein [Flavimarina sp. Hel_I_48]|uniref:DUF3667 domain-containing protein n=1 Tax=Flavimarina sp. Hel_I_48 TaxID=1392488 RepID=UPI0004DFA3F9|nr:DUF3667 domain-containing protein [Flavimarina sp. Hel_I_48]